MTFPPRHLLVGTDFSAASQHAVERAIDLARASAARLTLHHVLAASIWDDVLGKATALSGIDMESPAAAEAAAAEALRRRAAEIETATGLRCEAVVGTGRAAPALAQLAAEAGADLVVIGARGAHPIRDLMVGTTAQKLLQLSPCPVLVVKRPPPFDYRTVLVPTDFSAPSRGALGAVRALLPQATLHMAHAFELPYDGMARFASVDSNAIRHHQRIATERLHAVLLAFADEARVPPGQRVLRVDHGYAPRCIERWVQTIGCDLVAIAAHGKSELGALLLGSVSLHTVQAVPCDVLLMRGDPST